MSKPLKIVMLVGQVGSHACGIARGISLYAQTHAWIFSTIEDQQSAELNASSLYRPDHFEGDGIIAYTRNEILLRQYIDSGLPVVNTTQITLSEPPCPSVFTDDRLLGRLAADYFINRGFKNFAFFGSYFSIPFSVLRGTGFAEQVKEKGFSCSSFPPQDWPFDAIAWKRDHENVIRWLKSLDRPLALFTDNDSCGRIIADICLKFGIHVPNEISIVSTNNNELVCEFSNPHLSSVMLAKEQIGLEAAALLERLIRKKKLPPLPVLVPPLGITTRRSSDIFTGKDPYVTKALNFIYTHSGEEFRVTDILKTMRLSRRYLELRFRKETGRSLCEEIRRAHIEKAKELLAKTNLPMDQIAEATGFSGAKQFCVNFRKETRLSPTQYRKQFKIVKRAD